jgi:hypothetical protein
MKNELELDASGFMPTILATWEAVIDRITASMGK